MFECSHNARTVILDGSKPFCPICEPDKMKKIEAEWWVREVEDAMQFGLPDIIEAVRDIILVEKTKAYNDGRDGRRLEDEKDVKAETILEDAGSNDAQHLTSSE